MDEIVPVLLAFVAGIAITAIGNRHLRFVASVLAVLLSGAAATVASGEYHQSWIYLLLDTGEAAIGLTLGLLAAHLFSNRARRRSARDAGPTISGPR